MTTSSSNWIDISCFFANGVSEADLKAMLPAEIVVENGFICTDKQFDNNDLAEIFTGLIGLLNRQLDNAPCDDAFIDALWSGPFCQQFSDRFAFVNARGTGTLIVTAPAFGGPWEGALNYTGGGDSPRFDFGTNAASPVPIRFYDQSENIASGNNVVSLAGSESVAIPQTAAVIGSISGILINRGCV